MTVDRKLAGLTLDAATTAGDPTWVEPPFTPLEPPFVHDFGTPGNHAVVDATISAVSPGFLVVLAPYAEGAKGADGPLAVSAVSAGSGGAAWTIAGGTSAAPWRDDAWLRDASAPTTLVEGSHTLETDARFVLLSEAGDYALVADGTHVTLDGTALIHDNAKPVAVVPPPK